MMQIISFLAGLGFFFTGLHYLSASMQPIFSGKLRSILINFTRGPFSSALTGSFLGVITQSTSAATFLCLGLLNSGALTINRALAMVAWSGSGTALLVFLVSIDIKTASFFSLGIVGLMHLLNLTKDIKAKQIAAVFLAFGLLLFGLGLIKETGHVLNTSTWAREFFIFSAESSLIGLLIGIFSALIVQSSSSVAILAVALNMAGIIHFNEAMILVFGANIGSGLSVLFFASHLEGKKKQIAIYCFLSKLLGSLVLYPLTWLEPSKLFGFFNTIHLTINASFMLSLVYLALQLSGGLVVALFQNKIILLLNYLSPESEEENLFKLHFIYPESSDNTETALILVSKEQNRLIESLVDYLEPVRVEHERVVTIQLNTRHELTLDLLNKTKLFISETTSLNKNDNNTESLFSIQSRNEDMISLVNGLYSFEQNIEATHNFQKGLASSMVESLHLILTLLNDSLITKDNDDELLVSLTSDRSDLMEKIRDSLLNDQSINLEERQMLFISTSIFERIIWLIRRIHAARLVT